MSVYDSFSTLKTPQSEPLQGKQQVENSAGGFCFPVDDWKRLDRFLILGNEGGSYYASEKTLTKENAEAVLRCIAIDGVRVVKRIQEISINNRAPKVDPAIFSLAMVFSSGNNIAKDKVLEILPSVIRTGTHLFTFVNYAQNHRGWGRKSMLVYHVATLKKFRKYMEHHLILPPVRGWKTYEKAVKFAEQTHRKIILELNFVDYKPLEGHENKALVSDSIIRLPF